jgi:hypothetical protein
MFRSPAGDLSIDPCAVVVNALTSRVKMYAMHPITQIPGSPWTPFAVTCRREAAGVGDALGFRPLLAWRCSS